MVRRKYSTNINCNNSETTQPTTIVKENDTPNMPKKSILVQTNSNASTQSNDSLPNIDFDYTTDLLQLDFVKSVLSVNPCMV